MKRLQILKLGIFTSILVLGVSPILITTTLIPKNLSNKTKLNNIKNKNDKALPLSAFELKQNKNYGTFTYYIGNGNLGQNSYNNPNGGSWFSGSASANDGRLGNGGAYSYQMQQLATRCCNNFFLNLLEDLQTHQYLNNIDHLLIKCQKFN